MEGIDYFLSWKVLAKQIMLHEPLCRYVSCKITSTITVATKLRWLLKTVSTMLIDKSRKKMRALPCLHLQGEEDSKMIKVHTQAV